MSSNISKFSESYKESKYISKRLKENFNYEIDPILQRLGKYNKSDIPHKTYAQNYFQKMKLEEEKKGKKLTDFNKSMFKQSITERKLFSSRKIINDPKPQNNDKLKSLKTFRCMLKENTVADLLSKSMIVDDIPKNFKKNLGIPSSRYKKINDQRDLMPCEIEEKYKIRFNRTKSATRTGNTAERVFPELGPQEDSKEKKKLICYNNILRKQPWAKDNLSEIITYSNGPKYRKENLSCKPNLVSFNVVIKSRNNNVINSSKSFNLSSNSII